MSDVKNSTKPNSELLFFNNPKNIQQYVAKLVIIELRKRDEENLSLKKELENLRRLADKVEHCSVCYEPETNLYDDDDLRLYICYTCEKTVCNKQDCCKSWLLEFPKDGYTADYCSRQCYDADVV